MPLCPHIQSFTGYAAAAPEMFFIDLARLGMTLLLLTIATVKAKPEQCCSKKIVGSISYTLLPDTVHGQLPNQCLNNCIYTYTEQPKFCFAKGIAIFKRMSLMSL